MWQEDRDGTQLSGLEAALKTLRDRARRAIEHGDAHGFDVRQLRIRVRDNRGEIMFEGTTEEAASLLVAGCICYPKQA